jgi:von Willebrand factor type A domain
MSAPLPSWLQQWLGAPTTKSGDAVAAGLENAWPWAAWFTLLFVLFSITLVVYVYSTESSSAGRWMRALLAALRISAIAVVLLMIAQWIMTLNRTGLPYVVVMIDDSASMATADPVEGDAPRKQLLDRLHKVNLGEPTRLNLAKSLLLDDHGKLLDQLAQRYKLKVYFTSESARPQTGRPAELAKLIGSLEPTGAATRLGDGLRAVLNDLRATPPAAVVVLTDGITTEGESLAEASAMARQKGVPLFTIGLGSETPVRDVELSDLVVDQVVFANDVVNFDFKLTATGLANRQVEVAVKQKGSTQPLATQTITLAAAGKPQRVRLPYRPTQSGDFEYTVEARPLAEEARTDNNHETRLVSVREEKFRVLLVQAYPSFEFRYLKEMLKRDNTIQLRYLLQEADVDFAEADRSGEPMSLSSFPIKREELFDYDVVIFGDVNPALLSASDLRNLAAFVSEKGGGLIFIAGQRYNPVRYAGTPLAPLVPFEASQTVMPGPNDAIEEGFTPRPTELGLSSPQMELGDTPAETAEIWRKLPPLYFLAEATALKPAARVLAEHPSRSGLDGKPLPVFIQQYVGAGRVLFHCTDDTWRWRYQVGDVYFARYWVQSIRALSRSKLIGKDRGARLSTDRDRFERGQPIRLQVRFLDERMAPATDDRVTVMLERGGQSQARQTLTLHRSGSNRGVFETTLVNPHDGNYHVWMTEPTLLSGQPATDFQVLPPKGETARLEMDADQLRQAAEMTKGHFYTFATSGDLLKDLSPGKPEPLERLPPIELWNKWPLLVLVLTALITEWLLRKRCGMA